MNDDDNDGVNASTQINLTEERVDLIDCKKELHFLINAIRRNRLKEIVI